MKHSSYILSLLMFAFLSCTAQQKSLLKADEFDQAIKMADSIQILDVRTPGEYQEGHIDHSLLANWNDASEFDRRIAFLDKTKPVYVYCLAGGRSHAAAEKMRNKGFKQVFELQGGINAWKAANKKLEGTPSEPKMTLEQFNGALTSSRVVLVDVGATWCPPCKTMEPVIESIRKKHGDKYLMVNVDGGRDREILGHYAITQLPVFMIFKDGKLSWRRDGIATEEEITAELLK